MRKRRLIAILIAIAITFGVSAVWSASTIEREGDPDANVIEDSGARAGTATESKKGNKVARALAAPFKAFGKLLGHKDKNKLERMTEKDAEKFESVGVARLSEDKVVDQRKLISGSARDHL